jgi:flagellar motor switch protein FliM
VQVECRGLLGRTELPIGEIADLEVGDLIRLPVRADGLAELWIENVRAFSGTLGRSGRNLALKVSEVIEEIQFQQAA